MDFLASSIDAWVEAFRQLAPEGTFFNWGFNIYAFVAVMIASIICGSVGALVVGNRMAFLSDALAHCAFAGVALGLLLNLALRIPMDDFREWVTLITVSFGMLVGVLIALVRDKTGLASDTVIGVFFAGAIGLYAVVSRLAPSTFPIESFIFGQPAAATAKDIIYLSALLLVVVVFLTWCYNDLILASVNPSLALSRNVPIHFHHYLFVILLGVVVNLCLHVVGVLLINAFLIVPAAAAANLCRNLRQLFWVSVGMCVLCGVGGLFISWEISIQTDRAGHRVQIGAGGTIVVLTVLMFILSMVFGPAWRNRSVVSSRPT